MFQLQKVFFIHTFQMFSFVVENPECKRRKIVRSLDVISETRVTEIDSLEGHHSEPWAPFVDVKDVKAESDSDAESSDSDDAVLFWSAEQSPTQ